MPPAATELEKARGALTHNPILAHRDLDVEQSGDSLVISGRVFSFYEKQMAQEVVRAVCQDVQLRNSVSVND